MRTMMMLAAAMAATPAVAQEPQVLAVPGFANFAELDGQTVWINNEERLEHWSTAGKLGTVVMSSPCGSLVVLAPSVWAADCKDGTLNRVDMASLKVVETITTGIANPRGEFNVVAGAGSLWIPSDEKGEVTRIDLATHAITARIKVAPGSYYMAFGFGALWVASIERDVLQQIDPATNAVVRTIATGHQPGFLAAGEGAVWVQEQGDGTVARIDPATGTVTGRVKAGATLKWGEIIAGGGKIWLRTTEDQEFAVIDPRTMAIRARIGKRVGSGALRYTPAGLWTTEHDIQTMTWWPNPDKIG